MKNNLMTLDQQVCSLELAKKLKSLGVKQESLFYWWGWFSDRPPEGFVDDYNIQQAHEYQKWEMTTKEDILDIQTRSWKGMYKNTLTEYSAFTVAELGEMLPREIEYVVTKSYQGKRPMYFKCFKSIMDEKWVVSYSDPHHANEIPYYYEISETEADCRAKMLIYLLENKLLTL